MPSERAGPDSERFSDVDAISPSDVWAVGDRNIGFLRTQPVIEHWDGALWRVAQSPVLDDGQLSGVSGPSSDDVWAVGITGDSSLIEHWDGQQWSVVSAPGTRYSIEPLHAVLALGRDDAWAVGGAYGVQSGVPLIEHWNGRRWSLAPVPGEPDVYAVEDLYDISAISPDDIWAVGLSHRQGSRANISLALHWDGTEWRRASVPLVGHGYQRLNGVAMVSSTDVWAVGDRVLPSGLREPVFMHWDGSTWGVVSGPSPGLESGLSSVVALSKSDVWAVGGLFIRNVGGRTMVQHWNGHRWQVVQSPDPVRPGGRPCACASLSAVAAIDSELWAVGSKAYDHQLTLTERYGVPYCADGLDNEGDGLTDYPADPGCVSSTDGSEFRDTACGDGYDNDRDGGIDWPADPGCSGPTDHLEHGSIQCDDGRDNDVDGKTDYHIDRRHDLQCTSPSDPDESR